MKSMCESGFRVQSIRFSAWSVGVRSSNARFRICCLGFGSVSRIAS